MDIQNLLSVSQGHSTVLKCGINRITNFTENMILAGGVMEMKCDFNNQLFSFFFFFFFLCTAVDASFLGQYIWLHHYIVSVPYVFSCLRV